MGLQASSSPLARCTLAGAGVEGDRLTVFDAIGLRAGEQQQADVERVAVEQAGVTRRDHRSDAEMHQHAGRLFARRADAEVRACDDDIASLDLGCELWSYAFKAVACDHVEAVLHCVTRRELVGVDVGGELPGSHGLELAKPRAGARRRSDAAAPRCARGPLRCSIAWPAEKLASLPAVVALKQSRRVRTRSALTRAATRSALLGAAYVAADAHPPTALPAPQWHASKEDHDWCCAVGGTRWGRLVGRREGEAGRDQSSGLVTPAERPGRKARRDLQGQQRGRRVYSRASFI